MWVDSKFGWLCYDWVKSDKCSLWGSKKVKFFRGKYWYPSNYSSLWELNWRNSCGKSNRTDVCSSCKDFLLEDFLAFQQNLKIWIFDYHNSDCTYCNFWSRSCGDYWCIFKFLFLYLGSRIRDESKNWDS